MADRSQYQYTRLDDASEHEDQDTELPMCDQDPTGDQGLPYQDPKSRFVVASIFLVGAVTLTGLVWWFLA
jgi:hypothetical protein